MNILKEAKDPISCKTHFVGAILSLVALVVMIIMMVMDGASHLTMIGVVIFGLSSVALYSASSIYHYYCPDDKIKLVLRKLDHSMIYVLIAGTYTPISLTYLDYPHSVCFLVVIWLIAFIGIIIKLFWMNAPRFISTVFYLLMGWALVFDFPAFCHVPLGCFGLIAAGGISYTLGAFIYIFKKPNWFKAFGFHELFHVFVMIGSAFHFIAVIIYVL